MAVKRSPTRKGIGEMTTLANKKASKKTSYELMFFGMIVLAWAVMALLFNIARHGAHMDGDPTAAKTNVAGTVQPQ
jgi:hypothetical protein